MFELMKQFFRGVQNRKKLRPGAETAALIFGGGTAALPVTTSVAGGNFADFRTKSLDATGADSRGIYWRHYLAGDSGSGECARFFTTAMAAMNAIHGVHCSASFGTGGSLTGLAAGVRGTLQLPNAALAGTSAAIMGEVNAEGASSAIGGVTSLLRLGTSGNATGMGEFDTSGFVIDFFGLTPASGKAISDAGNEPSWTGKTRKLKCRLPNGSTTYVLAVDP